MPKAVQMFLALAGISLASGLALGGLDSATKEIIENNVLRFKKVPAVLNIAEGLGAEISDAQRPALEEQLLKDRRQVDVGADAPLLVFVYRQDGEVMAVAYEAFGKGFGGDVGVMIGFDIARDKLAGIGITTMSETPGLGTRATEPAFTTQFRGLAPDAGFKVKKDGGAIDAITGATITSRAVAAAVGQAAGDYGKHKAAIQSALNAPAAGEPGQKGGE